MILPKNDASPIHQPSTDSARWRYLGLSIWFYSAPQWQISNIWPQAKIVEATGPNYLPVNYRRCETPFRKSASEQETIWLFHGFSMVCWIQGIHWAPGSSKPRCLQHLWSRYQRHGQRHCPRRGRLRRRRCASGWMGTYVDPPARRHANNGELPRKVQGGGSRFPISH